MNKRVVFIAILVIGILLAGWWFLSSSKVSQPAVATEAAKPTASIVAVISQPTSALSTLPPKPRLFKSNNYPPQTTEEKAMWEWYNTMEKTDPNFQQKMPIEFYGKVVDQFGKPIPGVTVVFQWTTVVGPVTNPERQTLSGTDGRFELRGVQGKVLQVKVLKNGYEDTDDWIQNFEYASFFNDNFYVPDPNNPVLFHLRKILDAEPMYLFKTHNDLSPGSPPLTLDVASGKMNTPGDFAFSVQIGEKSNKNWFDYSVSVEALNGAGFIVTTEENPNRAPDNGYQKTFAIQQMAADTNYSPNLSFRFYARTREGKYGVVYVDMTVPRSGPINFYTVVRYNPSGSKNLEFDYRKWINR
jgi:Carboxypeptidase regulatory-like domain